MNVPVHYVCSVVKPPMNWTKGDMLEAKDFETDYMCHDLDTGQQLVVKEVDIVPHSHSDAPKVMYTFLQ